MKKYCFLVQCGSHSNDLSGKLAILTTDSLQINFDDQGSANEFIPGTSISWTPLKGGSCSAMILANLSIAGYDQGVREKHIKFNMSPGVNPDWFKPEQFLEVRSVHMERKWQD